VKKRVQSVCKLERRLKFRVMQSGIWGVKPAGRTLWEFPLAIGGMFTRCREDYHHLTDPHTYLMAQRCHCSHVNDQVWFVHTRVFLVKCDLYNNIASASQERETETHTNVNTRHWTVNTLLLWLYGLGFRLCLIIIVIKWQSCKAGAEISRVLPCFSNSLDSCLNSGLTTHILCVSQWQAKESIIAAELYCEFRMLIKMHIAQ
jgi:hypothetical protein